MYNPKMQCTEIVQYNDSMKFRETPHRHYANNCILQLWKNQHTTYYKK
jgi:hypothetical protein